MKLSVLYSYNTYIHQAPLPSSSLRIRILAPRFFMQASSFHPHLTPPHIVQVPSGMIHVSLFLPTNLLKLRSPINPHG